MSAIFRLFADLADAPHRAPWIWRLKAARWPVAILSVAAVMLLVAGVPLGNLAYKAGVQVPATEDGRVRAWSPAKLVERSWPHRMISRASLWLSAGIGAAAATAAVVIALPLAWSMRDAISQPAGGRQALGWRWVGLLMIALCLTIPGPLLGVGVIRLLNRPPDSPFSALAWLVRLQLRSVARADGARAAAGDAHPVAGAGQRAASDARHGGDRRHRLVGPAAADRPAAALAGRRRRLARRAGRSRSANWRPRCSSCRRKLAATALSIQIFQLLHYGVDDRVAAICLVMVFAIAAVTGIAAVLLKRKIWVTA